MTPPAGLEPKSPPTWAKWQYLGSLGGGAGRMQFAWNRDRLLVLSSLILAEHEGEQRWQWMVTVSARTAEGKRRRPTDAELARALRDFGMEKAEEESELPGHRGFYLLCETPAAETAEAIHRAARSRG